MELVDKAEVDFILVVGGFDSSNTAHLKEIPEKFGVESYHIDRPERISADNVIEHRESDGRVVKHEKFLKKGPMTIGITSGASTPDRLVYLGTFFLNFFLSSCDVVYWCGIFFWYDNKEFIYNAVNLK
jgi:4-hydroxy-3-methylbut-2-enyl diphosphate reductase IspH